MQRNEKSVLIFCYVVSSKLAGLCETWERRKEGEGQGVGGGKKGKAGVGVFTLIHFCSSR